MYLHGGNNRNIRKKNIIGIFDMDTATVSKITKQFLRRCEKEKRAEMISYELPKSFILTEEKKPKKTNEKENTEKITAENNEDKIYFSPLATSTLVQRTR